MDTEGFDGDAELRSKLRDLMDIERKGELGRARAEADGWLRVATRRLRHIAECESALAKRNERIRKLEKRVKQLEGELRDVDQPTERERQIIDMWPRFEDGEYVWYGDEVDNMRSTVIAVEFFDGAITLSSDFDHLHLSFGERVKRPVQSVLDADGVEIHKGEILQGVGRSQHLFKVLDPHHVDPEIGEAFSVRCIDLDDSEECHCRPGLLTHTRPDSWERLEEDAEKEACDYFGVECDEDKGCSGCPHLHEGRDCTIDMQADLVRRAKALAGVEVE